MGLNFFTMELAIFLYCILLATGAQAGVIEKSALPSVSTQSAPLIVIDTDGGIDDCEAMLLVLTNQDKAKLLAMTCLFGDTDVDNACNNALRTLVLADSQGIPVHKGSSGSMATGKYVNVLEYFLGHDGLANRSHEFSTGGQQLSEIPAAVALSQLARSHPGEITLLAIGPLTNLALAHRIDPYFTHHLKEIVILGGNYKGIVKDRAEFNFQEDPLAANIVLTEAACPLTMIPSETTKKSGIPWDKYHELTKIDTRLGRFFQRVTEIQSGRERDSGQPDMFLVYDFVAAAVFLYPEIVTSTEWGSFAVEYEGRLTQGATVVLHDPRGRTQVKIVTGVNDTAIVELFQRMLVGSSQ